MSHRLLERFNFLREACEDGGHPKHQFQEGSPQYPLLLIFYIPSLSEGFQGFIDVSNGILNSFIRLYLRALMPTRHENLIRRFPVCFNGRDREAVDITRGARSWTLRPDPRGNSSFNCSTICPIMV